MKTKYFIILIVLVKTLGVSAQIPIETIYLSDNYHNFVSYSFQDFSTEYEKFSNQTNDQKTLYLTSQVTSFHDIITNTEITPQIMNDILKNSLSETNYLFIKQKERFIARFIISNNGAIISSAISIVYKKNENHLTFTSDELRKIFNFFSNCKFNVTTETVSPVNNFSILTTYVFPLRKLP